MPVSAQTPAVATGTVLFLDGMGHLHVTAIVKVTYALRPDAVAALAPPLPLTEDVHVDDARSPGGSLYAASDYAPCKVRAEVVVVGRVHPRDAAAVRQVVGFALARGPDVLLTKRLVAIGERGHIEAAPKRLTELPLSWEHTSGWAELP